jgi:hypothetical protein
MNFRLADMDNQGGMAAMLSLDSNLADFATISAYKKKVLLVWSIGTRTKPKKSGRYRAI